MSSTTKMIRSKKQQQLLEMYKLKQRKIIADGAMRTGKTLFLSYGFGILANDYVRNRPSQEKGHNHFAIVSASSVENAHNNVAVSVVEMLESLGYMAHKTGYNYKLSKMVVENDVRTLYEIYLHTYALNDVSSAKRLQGGTFRAIFFDEAPLMHQHGLKVGMTRQQSFKDGKIIMTGNPEGPKSHWFYRDYIAPNDPDTFRINFTLLDNPTFDTDDAIGFARTLNSSVLIKRFVIGEWIAAENNVYGNKQFKKITMEDALLMMKEIGLYDIYAGIDYGERDATVVIITAHLKNDEKIILDCWYNKTGVPHPLSPDRYTFLPTLDINQKLKSIIEFLNERNKFYVSNGFYDLVVKCEYTPAALYDLMVNSLELDLKIKVVQATKLQVKDRIFKTNVLLGHEMLYGVVHGDYESNAGKLVQIAMDGATYNKKEERADDGSTEMDVLDAFEYSISEYFNYVEI